MVSGGAGMAIVLGLVGAVFILNGLMMLPVIETALQQQVAAVYIVGGFIVLSVAVVAGRLGKVVAELVKIGGLSFRNEVVVPVAEVSGAPTESQPPAPPRASSRTLRSDEPRHMILCPNCGKENPPNMKLCPCGMSL